MFPAIDSNLHPDALVRQVLVHYQIGEPVRCRLQARGLNDTYKVQAGPATYYLRVYRAGWRNREEVETELAMLGHLARCGACVSVPLARSDDRTLTPLNCAEGERHAVLFTAAPGREVDYKAFTEEQAGRYGEAAATIHAAAESFDGPRLRAPLDLAALLDRPVELVAAALAHRADDRAYVTALATRLRHEIEAAAGLETGFCHGDFHGGNSCECGETFTFYDFDCCGWGLRAYDLAVFPWGFAVGENAPERIEAMGRAFLSGYRRRRPIASLDLAAIPAFAAIRQLWLMGLHLGLVDRFGAGWINDRYFDRHVKILRDWDERFLSRPAAAWLEGSGT